MRLRITNCKYPLVEVNQILHSHNKCKILVPFFLLPIKLNLLCYCVNCENCLVDRAEVVGLEGKRKKNVASLKLQNVASNRTRRMSCIAWRTDFITPIEHAPSNDNFSNLTALRNPFPIDDTCYLPATCYSSNVERIFVKAFQIAYSNNEQRPGTCN